MSNIDPDTYLKAQTVLTVALAFVVGVAGWGVKRFIRLVDRLEDKVDGLLSRVAVLEARAGILTGPADDASFQRKSKQ